MNTTTIIPGLDVDDSLFQAAAAGIAEHAADLVPLTWERFTTPTAWTLVPDDCGDGYKAELVLLNRRERTVKVNLWFLPDLRGGSVSQPHSHPWDFTAHILLGGYTEDRYEPSGRTVRAARGVEHRRGSCNAVPRSVYHEVSEIHEPGRTLTLMVCDRGERGAWGYLDTATGEHQPVQPDPGFMARLAAVNPQHR